MHICFHAVLGYYIPSSIVTKHIIVSLLDLKIIVLLRIGPIINDVQNKFYFILLFSSVVLFYFIVSPILILGSVYFALRMSFINCFCLHNSNLANDFSSLHLIDIIYWSQNDRLHYCQFYHYRGDHKPDCRWKFVSIYRFTLLKNRCQLFIAPLYN